MKVKELIEKLKEFDPEMEVVVNDSEFGFSHLDEPEVQTGRRFFEEEHKQYVVI